MKKIAKIILSVTVCATIFSACGDLLETGSDRIVFEEDNTLSSANDSLYSVAGILGLLRELGDRYVILGELRGDLMDITENSDLDLQEINDHNVSSDNPYASIKEYYAVINNCNYFIQHVDTSIVSAGVFTALKEYAAVKTIRAWTYLQLGLVYGKATYIEQPILSLDDMNKDYPVLDLQQLVEKLIADLEPYINVEKPSYDLGIVGFEFIPIRLLLGDLYLWKGDYGSAANAYFNLMYQGDIYINPTAAGSRWMSESFEFPYDIYDGFIENFMFLSTPRTLFAFNYSDSIYGTKSNIPNMVYPKERLNQDLSSGEYKLMFSNQIKEMWDNEIYTYYSSTTRQVKYIKGDLRGYSSYGYTVIGTDSIPYINKLRTQQTRRIMYRSSGLYLHYAEAINQLGFPATAFAVLKDGLNRTTTLNPKIIPESERINYPSYINFTSTRFDNNLGTRYGGLGTCQYDSVYFVIPELATLQDSIVFVDNEICKELALETAFEGNRFSDLMRFAVRRNDPSFLANKVGAKNPRVKEKLMDRNNWFLPWKD